MVNLLPTKRKLYQTRLTRGPNRGGLTHADKVHGTDTRLLADAHMSRLTRGPSTGGLTHADEVHGTDTGYMVSQLELKN